MLIDPVTMPEQSAALTPTIGLDEAGKLLHCHPDTVRKMAKAGKLPGTKVGRSWVFYTDSLLEWLQARIKAGAPHEFMGDGGSSDLIARLDAEIARQSARKPRRQS
jgi:excisionase family DNA binding protein